MNWYCGKNLIYIFMKDFLFFVKLYEWYIFFFVIGRYYWDSY